MIPEWFIEEVRARVDVAEVIGRRVALRKSGASLLGACPFHEEKSPSFRVYPDQKRFRCYGCGAHGDVFEFARMLEGREFPAIILGFAAELGMALPDEPAPQHLERYRKEKAGALGACEAAASRWEERLRSAEGESARACLRAIGVGDAAMAKFRLGLASPSWRDVTVELPRVNGLSIEDVERAGLTVRGRGARLDRFRGRLMFPCSDAEGKIVGFAGRAFPGEAGPPWLVSRPSVLMKLDREFFGLHQAAAAIRKSAVAIVVPGCDDVVRVHEAGVQNVLAPVGAWLGAGHLSVLARRGARSVVLVGGVAGLSSEAISRLASAVFGSPVAAAVADARVLTPVGEKPLRRDELDAAISDALPFSEYLIGNALDRAGAIGGTFGSVEQRLTAASELGRHAAGLPAGLARSTFERRIAQRLRLNLEVLRSAIKP